MSTPKAKELFLASSLRDGLEDNNINQVATLLERNEADPNVLLPMHGISPFHLVIGNESEAFAEDVTRLFLRHGGDPNVRSIDRMTPVHVAAAWGRVNILELLLANGGDPLAVDDEGRSPFHYAFEGAFYEAIGLLAQYCTKNQEDDSMEEGGAGIQVKLEKILVNKGDVIAEYVPSEIDLTEDFSTIEETVPAASKETSGISPGTSLGTSFKAGEGSSSSSNTAVSLQTTNITLRRNQACKTRQISPILPDKTSIFGKKRSPAEERLLVGEIIHRLSDSFSKSEKDHLNSQKDTAQNNGKKSFCSLLPKPRFFKKDLGTPKKTTIIPGHLDNSIISTSPNFRVDMKREEITPKKTAKNRNFSPNYRSPATEACGSPEVRSASSTPKRTPGFPKRIGQKKRNNTSLNKTYDENELELSPDVEDDLKRVNRRLLSKELVKKLEETFDEVTDFIESNYSEKHSGFPKMSATHNLNNKNRNNNIEATNGNRNGAMIKLCNNPLKQCSDKNDRNNREKRSPGTPRSVKNCLNVPAKSDNKKFIFQSPGSSNPRSLTSSPMRECTREEIEFWDEIDEIYRQKGKSPLASVSQFSNKLEDSGSSSVDGSSVAVDVTLSTNGGKWCREDCGDFTGTFEETEIYETPLLSMMSSRCSLESFFSVDEEYAYVDSEKNVAFLERRLRVLPSSNVDMNNVKNESTWVDMLERLSLGSASSMPTSDAHSSTFPGDYHSLRSRLIALGEAPGPITDTTFHVYLKRLRRLEKTTNLAERTSTTERPPAYLANPKNIPKDLLSTDFLTNYDKFRNIEHDAFREYERPSGRNYRGGLAKVSFNYLLLDPRVTNDLPRSGGSLSVADRWNRFLQAIFYIGKGKSARPAAHLYEAFDLWTGKRMNDQPSEKLRKIVEIWKSGKGVISLQVFSNSMQEEAFTREAAMIDALGSSNLSNCMRGQYYGFVSTMNMGEKRILGNFLLYKAMQIFMHEGERQLLPRNLE